jgi:5'-deoxy-5'-methylthioadenosine phosphorylase
MLAIIGGSGFAELANLEVVRRQVVRTPYGEPSGAVTFGRLNGRDVVFLARHGYGHTIPPHAVNYRANVWALSSLQVSGVIAIASVGAIRADLEPGGLVLPEQIIDYTHGRRSTFFEGQDRSVTHIDFTHPYSRSLQQQCLRAAELAQVPLTLGGVYGATQGPRLETAAEINRLERDGVDMVGMTGMPEAALAREIGLQYAALAVVANAAAGRGGSHEEIRLQDLQEVLQLAMGKVRRVLDRLVEVHGG